MSRSKSTFFNPFSAGFPSVVGQSIPRCHFPMQAVWYPASFNRSATVFLFWLINGREWPLSTPFFKRVRQAYLPVNNPYLVGVHTPELECASINVIPSAAILSRYFVGILFRQLTSPQPRSSARIYTMLGCFSDDDLCKRGLQATNPIVPKPVIRINSLRFISISPTEWIPCQQLDNLHHGWFDSLSIQNDHTDVYEHIPILFYQFCHDTKRDMRLFFPTFPGFFSS